MRVLIWILVIVASGVAGYGIRMGREGPDKARTGRSEIDTVGERKRILANLSETEREELLLRQFPELVRLRREEQERIRARKMAESAPEPAAPTEAELDAEAKAMMKQFHAAMNTQLPSWKATFGVNARSTGMQIAKALGLEGEVAEQFAAAFKAEGARAAERGMALFSGEFDGDPSEMEQIMDGFSWMMGTAGIMSDELATDLGNLIGDEEIGAARDELRTRNKAHIGRQIDMQVGMMNLPELSGTQKAEIKEVFGGGMMKEQTKIWGEIMKEPRRLMQADTEEKWAELIEPSMKPNRDRMRTILTDEQFSAYRDYEKTSIEGVRIWLEPYMKMARTK